MLAASLNAYAADSTSFILRKRLPAFRQSSGSWLILAAFLNAVAADSKLSSLRKKLPA
ncbi:hypothetical protein Psal006b_02268 [Piscirickettsia salmonis]|uniref:Tetratricopeptide repeat family protein n=2 Tax=Piscirickettsia salmonis TaxID=1238 RepID=A0AAC9EUS2_PISSA|nr:hypothetical protein [Piscirickettsia salmonis]ALB22124.1 tetratricopeptide repeat family protein [Piscirickettsia salmonis]QGN99264.1 hypothetical protein Psal006b_02268 [Piscirickettsia salmonis]QGO02895.1 hypothetical protein Psal008_02287 [Piscirickettsia salmonis]QGO13558.1 hypothetical protein Psal010b_02264 [Piscirickettsia salmonis]QGO20632.1 hypothetical protein Psal013_02296 [Piscirickettsia salmonis]